MAVAVAISLSLVGDRPPADPPDALFFPLSACRCLCRGQHFLHPTSTSAAHTKFSITDGLGSSDDDNDDEDDWLPERSRLLPPSSPAGS